MYFIRWFQIEWFICNGCGEEITFLKILDPVNDGVLCIQQTVVLTNSIMDILFMHSIKIYAILLLFVSQDFKFFFLEFQMSFDTEILKKHFQNESINEKEKEMENIFYNRKS